jgi:hypothetical protein
MATQLHGAALVVQQLYAGKPIGAQVGVGNTQTNVSNVSIAAAAGASGGGGGSGEHGLLSIFNPVTRSFGYGANYTMPNVAASVHDLINVWKATDIPWSRLKSSLLWHGAFLPSTLPEINLQQGASGRLGGLIGIGPLGANLGEGQHSPGDFFTQEFMATLSPEEKVKVNNGQIQEGTILFSKTIGNINSGLLSWNSFNNWAQTVVASQSPPPHAMLVANYQLGRTNKKDTEFWLRRSGYKEKEARELVLNAPFVFSIEQARDLWYLDRQEIDALHASEEAPATEPGTDIYAAADRLYEQRLAAAGMPDKIDQAAWSRLPQSVTYNEAIELANRDLLQGRTDADRRIEFNRLMTLDGFNDDTILDYLWKLRQRLPTEGELIEAAVKNAFVGPLAKILGLDEEYHDQPQFIVGTDRLGLSGSPFIQLDDMKRHIQSHRLHKGDEYEGHVLERDETVEEADERATKYFESQDRSLLTWAQMLWRSHWVNLSPSQIYQCLQRQRVIDETRLGGTQAVLDYDSELQFIHGTDDDTPENRYAIAVRYAMVRSAQNPRGLGLGRDPTVPPVTMDIVNTVLRANDYAPLFRPNLAGISYNVLRLVDINRMVQRSLANRAFAVVGIGYNEEVADKLPDERNGGGVGDNAVEPTPLQKFVFAWAREQFLDRGQTPDSAQSLATLAVVRGQTSNKVQLRRVTRAYERGYRVGLINAATLNRLLLLNRPQPPALRPGETLTVFGEADMAASIYDDAGSMAYLTELDSVYAAEDNLETGDDF